MNVMYIVMNADVPVMYVAVSLHIHVNCVIMHSVNRAIR